MTLATIILSLPLWLIASGIWDHNRRMHHMSVNLARLQASAVSIVAIAAAAVAALEAVPQKIRDAIEADEAQEDGELGQLADSLDAAGADLKAQLPTAAADAGHVDEPTPEPQPEAQPEPEVDTSEGEAQIGEQTQAGDGSESQG